jgi:hypothetical protein
MFAGKANDFAGGKMFVEFWAGAGKISISPAAQRTGHQRG